MNPSEITEVVKRDRRFRWTVFLTIFAVYSFVHVAEPTSIYHYRLADYENVVPVIHKLLNPSLFPEDFMIGRLVKFELAASPLYHGLVTIPLGLFFHPVTVMKLTGWILAVGLFVFSSYPGRTSIDWFRGALTSLVFLHAGLVVSPLPGNRRHFAVLFIVLALLLDRSENPYYRYLLVAVAAGIYPPTALLILCFFVLKKLATFRKSPKVYLDRFREIILYCLIFLTVMTPYVITKIFLNPTLTDTRVPGLKYQLTSFSGIVESLLVDSRGAFFRFPGLMIRGLTLWLIVLVIFLIIDRGDWIVRDQFKRLILGSCLLWGLAHLMHPYLYQPSKYTKIVPGIVACYLIAENLPALHETIRNVGTTTIWRVGLYLCSLLGATILLLNNLGSGDTYTTGVFLGLLGDEFFVRFCGASLIFLSVMLILPVTRRGLTVSLLVMGLLVFVFNPPFGWFKVRRGYAHLPSYFKGAFKALRQTPNSTRVAAPRRFSEILPVYAKRPVYFRQLELSPALMNERRNQYKSFVCSSNLNEALRNLSKIDVDVIFIDRKLLSGTRYCPNNTTTDIFFVDWIPEDPLWSKEHYGLYGKNTIKQKLKTLS